MKQDHRELTCECCGKRGHLISPKKVELFYLGLYPLRCRYCKNLQSAKNTYDSVLNQ